MSAARSGAATVQRRPVAARALLRTAWVYGLAGWAYVAVVAVVRPAALGQPVWHGTGWPHRDTFGAIAFVVSCLACLSLQLRGEGVVDS